jgi:hypothetical protein
MISVAVAPEARAPPRRVPFRRGWGSGTVR